VTVTTTATQLAVGAAGDNTFGSSVVIRPTADIFVGGLDVTVAAGFRVVAGSTFTMDLDLYGIVATGTSVTSVLRRGVS
jgi:hypothetical protein